MKRIAIFLGCALACAGCSSPEDQLENAIRNELSSRGTVEQVELTKQDANRMTGFATVRANGVVSRLNCTATRDGGQGSHFTWRCIPTIDDAMLRQMEGTIRESLTRQQVTVDQVQMTRQDDDHMTGFANVHDAAGNLARTNCTAGRAADGTFSWQCAPGDGAQAAAPGEPPAGQGAEPAPADEGGK
jgi:beta-lactamase superfamily II metal-dependent hydrolase